MMSYLKAMSGAACITLHSFAIYCEWPRMLFRASQRLTETIMAQDIGWSRFNDWDVAFAKGVGIALNAPDERTTFGPHDEDDDDEDEPLFMNAVRLHNYGF
jgi:hypothetical protein